MASIYDKLTQPLTDLPSRLARKLSTDKPMIGSNLFDPNSKLGKVEGFGNKLNAMIRGFSSGAVEGAGDLISDVTSPVSLAMAGLGLPRVKNLLGLVNTASKTLPVGPTRGFNDLAMKLQNIANNPNLAPRPSIYNPKFESSGRRIYDIPNNPVAKRLENERLMMENTGVGPSRKFY